MPVDNETQCTKLLGYLKAPHKVFYRASEKDSNQSAVLFIHGFSEHSGRYEQLTEHVCKNDFDFFAFDLRGHGKSAPCSRKVSCLEEYLEDTSLMIDFIKAKKTYKNIMLLGHSMGGLVAIYAIQKHKKDIAGLVLCNPLLKVKVPVPWWKHNLAIALSKVLPNVLLPSGIEVKNLTSVKKIQNAYLKDPLVKRKASVRWYFHICQALKNVSLVKNITIPMLLQISPKDKIVDINEAKKWWEKQETGKEKTLVEYPDLEHEIYQEKSQKPFEDLMVWLKKIQNSKSK